METHLSPEYKDSKIGKIAEDILSSCVHCGFCTATCPTYQQLGDELDGPRGRIYQIKNLFEGEPPTRETQVHLDRCLTCLSCMTTCPSGVEYNKLIDIGRDIVEEKVPRPLSEKVVRWGLRQILPYPQRFNAAMTIARIARPLAPGFIKNKITPAQSYTAADTDQTLARKVIIHQGCVQKSLTPATDAAAMRVLEAIGISSISAQGNLCCGAVNQHLADSEQAKVFIRANIDAWWPHIQAGAEAILVTASGCGVMVKDYAHLMADEPDYAEKATRISELTKDLAEILTLKDIKKLTSNAPKNISFHSPCSLQHGQKLNGKVEALLSTAGFKLAAVKDPHLCCGSAGTYSVLQQAMSKKLLNDKLSNLQASEPALIATANVGCQTHLMSDAKVPTVHWVELFDPLIDWQARLN